MTWSATDSSKPDHAGPLTFVAACRLPPFPSSIIQTEAGSQMWYRGVPTSSNCRRKTHRCTPYLACASLNKEDRDVNARNVTYMGFLWLSSTSRGAIIPRCRPVPAR